MKLWRRQRGSFVSETVCFRDSVSWSCAVGSDWIGLLMTWSDAASQRPASSHIEIFTSYVFLFWPCEQSCLKFVIFNHTQSSLRGPIAAQNVNEYSKSLKPNLIWTDNLFVRGGDDCIFLSSSNWGFVWKITVCPENNKSTSVSTCRTTIFKVCYWCY